MQLARWTGPRWALLLPRVVASASHCEARPHAPELNDRDRITTNMGGIA